MSRTYMKLMSFALALVVAMAGSFSVTAQDSTPVPSSQDENRSLAFYPEETGQGTFITVELNPGESAEIPVVVGNTGSIEQTIRTYSVNALSSANGGFVLDDYETEPSGATAWVTYPEQVFTFEPTEGVQIPVEITVPDDATAGEFVTGLAVEQAEPFEVPGSAMYKQRVRWSLPILVVVPGEREPAFELGEAELRHMETDVIANIHVANTGNVTVRPIGTVRLLDSTGTVVGVSEIEMNSVYTGTSTHFVVAWREVPQSDTYSVEVMLTAEEGIVTVEQEYADLVPLEDDSTSGSTDPLSFTQAEMSTVTDDVPPSILVFDGNISNSGSAIEEARVSIVTYRDGEEIDRYPIMQAVTLSAGDTPIEARYSLPGGFTDGTYTFEVTIELGSGSSQSVLVTQPIDFELTVGD